MSTSRFLSAIQKGATQKDWWWMFGCANLNALLFFAPVLFELGGRTRNPFAMLYRAFFHTETPEVIIGDGVDPLGSFWIVTKVRHMLTGQSETKLPDLYAPFGFDIALHEGYAWADTLFAMPWELIIGTPGFYNVHVYQTLVLSYLACCTLFRTAGAPLYFALILSNVALLHRFGIGEIAYGRPTQMNWVFPCLFLIGILKMQRGQNQWLWALWTGLALGLSCLVYWFGGAAVGLCGAVVYACHCLRHRQWNSVAAGLLSATTAMVLCLSITWRVSKSVVQGKGNKAYQHLLKSTEYDIDLGPFALPIKQVKNVNDWDTVVELFVLSSMPIMVLVFAALALFRSKALWSRWPWLIASIVAIGIPLDYAIRIGDTIIPTGYSVLNLVFPPVVRCIFADRMMVAPTLFLLTLFSFALVRWELAQQARFKVLMFALLLLNLSYTPSRGDMFVTEFRPKTSLATLKGGLIEVPFRVTNESYVQQLWHGQTTIGGPGIMMLRSKAHERYVQRNNVLSGLEQIASGESLRPHSYDQRDVLQLRKDGFRYVVLHLNHTDAEPSDFELFLNSTGKTFKDDHIMVIELPKRSPN